MLTDSFHFHIHRSAASWGVDDSSGDVTSVELLNWVNWLHQLIIFTYVSLPLYLSILRRDTLSSVCIPPRSCKVLLMELTLFHQSLKYTKLTDSNNISPLLKMQTVYFSKMPLPVLVYMMPQPSMSFLLPRETKVTWIILFSAQCGNKSDPGSFVLISSLQWADTELGGVLSQ
jgi:hypothetical protein